MHLTNTRREICRVLGLFLCGLFLAFPVTAQEILYGLEARTSTVFPLSLIDVLFRSFHCPER